MPLNNKQKQELLDILKAVDVKQLQVEHKDERIVKWFRFGSYNGLQIAREIIKALPEKPSAKTKVKVS